jgi:choline dehydrogenase
VSSYDFIVVGTGSAGCVVASRLSEDPSVSVLSLEAGGSQVPDNVNVPALWYTLLGSEVDWSYSSVPQPGLGGRQTFEPRGKIPGGSGNFYIMMHIRGHRSDYDSWAYNGCPGWGYDDILPYFQRMEDQSDDPTRWAGKGGPIPAIHAGMNGPNPTSRAFIDACLELGFPFTDDFNGPDMEGVGWHHLNIRNGKRAAPYQQYLTPALSRPNLTLSTNSTATKLIFNRKRCTGVEFVRDGKVERAEARHEVIVCGGAIESPKLLQLSGIGNPELLRDFDIPVVADLPGVGENFHNHVLTGIIYECKKPVPPPNLNLSEAALFCKSDPGWIGPDLQIAFVHVPFDIIVGQGHPNSISILPGVVRPLSRGWVRLASADPTDKPLVNPNYLGVQSDRDRLVQSVKLSREIFGTKAFSEWVGPELKPGPEVSTQKQLVDFVCNTADSYHHQAGSCKMGLDAMAVVDPNLRVRGVDGLRVVDASVMPFVPSGNCHAGILMIAERAVDLIKQANKMPAKAKAKAR